MIEKTIMCVLGLILGIIISRIITHVEVHSLKEQLFESEENNEIIIKDNADLVRQNDILRKQIHELTTHSSNKRS